LGDNIYRALFQLHTCLAIYWSLRQLTRLQVLYNLTLLYAVITSFMFTHTLVFYTPFINTATADQRENNELSDGQVTSLMHAFIKACPHCRRKVRQFVAENFCDSVDRALAVGWTTVTAYLQVSK